MTEHEQAVTIIGAAIAAGDMDQVAQHYVNAVATGTEQVMQLVKAARADERKKLREALLDSGAVSPAAIRLEQMNEQGRFHPIMYWQSAAHAAINTALAAIGLTEEDV